MYDYANFELIRYLNSRKKLNEEKIKELLENNDVKEYVKLLNDITSINYQLLSQMKSCNHIFIQTEKYGDKENISGEKIYHCVRCGLTNEYSVKGIPCDIIDMDKLYSKSFLEGHIIGGKVFSFEKAMKIYRFIASAYPGITQEEAINYFMNSYEKAYVEEEKKKQL